MKKILLVGLLLLTPASAQIYNGGPTRLYSPLPAVASCSAGQYVTAVNGSASPTCSSASAGSITVGTTTITGGSNGRVEYNNAGTLGEMTTTGSGTVLALAASPVFTAPTLGVATGTSFNGLTVTSSTGTFTLANAKTLVVNNTLTFTGTDSSSVAFGAGGTIGSVGYATVGQIPGTATNDTATAGNVGETLRSDVLSGAQVVMSCGSQVNITSKLLTAGEWLVWFRTTWSGGTTVVNSLQVSISTTSATVDTTDATTSTYFATNGVTQFANGFYSLPAVGPRDMKLSSSTTVYGVGIAQCSVANPSAFGTLIAQRIR